MKALRRHFFSLLLVTVVFGLTRAQSQQQNPSVVGTYEYLLEGREGMAIFTNTHFMWVISPRGLKTSVMHSSGDSARVFASSSVGAGTYEFAGPSTIKVHRTYSTDPNRIGKEFTFQYEFQGDVMKYWVLRSDGTRGEMGKAQRISN